jgi:hypothetical protein
LSNTSVDENQPSGTIVGLFSTTDPDAGDAHAYSFATGSGDTDNALFSIVGTTLTTAATFNFEARSSYGIRVQTTDSRGSFFEDTLTISVSDVNESPVAQRIASVRREKRSRNFHHGTGAFVG